MAKRHISQKRINQIDVNLYCPEKKMYCIQKTVVNNEMRPPTKKTKRREATEELVGLGTGREVKQ